MAHEPKRAGGRFLGERLAAAINLPILREKLTLSTFSIFGLRIAFLGVSFVTGVVLARLLGVEMFGNYSLAMAWTGFLGVLATLGLPELITREVPAQSAKGTWKTLRGLLLWSDGVALTFASALSLIGIGLAWLFVYDTTPALFWAFALALPSLPLYALLRLKLSTVQGLGFPLQSQYPELLVRPIAFLVLFVSVAFLFPALRTGAGATAMLTASRAFALIACVWILWQVRPASLRDARPTYSGGKWLRTTLPFLAISSIYVVSTYTDSIMLGLLQNSAAVGIYSVANQGAQLILFALMAVSVVVTPEISRLHAAGDHAGLQRIITQSARLVAVVALLIAATLVVFGRPFLGIFGAEFVQGYSALLLLSVAQLVNAITGLAGTILAMTGLEWMTLLGFSIGGVINVALNAALIPIAGVDGAAAATAVSIVIQNILLAYWVRRRLKINSLPIGSVTVRDQ